MAQCTICTHPERAAMENRVHAGDALLTVANAFAVGRESLRRHLASHVEGFVRGVVRKAPTHRVRTQPPRQRKPGQNIPDAEYAGLQADFLLAFIEAANISAASRAVGIDRSTVYEWQEHDPGFAVRFGEAQAIVNDHLIGAMYRRAVHGCEEPVVSAGKVMYNSDGSVMTVLKYSDRMAEVLAKARMPEMFGDKSKIDVTSNGATVGQGIPLDQLAVLMRQARDDVSAWETEHGYGDTDTPDPR